MKQLIAVAVAMFVIGVSVPLAYSAASDYITQQKQSEIKKMKRFIEVCQYEGGLVIFNFNHDHNCIIFPGEKGK